MHPSLARAYLNGIEDRTLLLDICGELVGEFLLLDDLRLDVADSSIDLVVLMLALRLLSQNVENFDLDDI